jgi:hypothetical protein
MSHGLKGVIFETKANFRCPQQLDNVGMLTEERESTFFAIKTFECIVILMRPFENAGRVIPKNTHERMSSSVDDFRHGGDFVLLKVGNWNPVHGHGVASVTTTVGGQKWDVGLRLKLPVDKTRSFLCEGL